jgi:arginyl-tRNA synthetase
MISMKMFNEMSLRAIRKSLEKVGVEMDDAQFNSLTYSELRKVYRKSKKAYELYKQVDAIICKKKAPTPAVPIPEEKTTKGA